jgi:hypothetical protein
MKKLNFSLISFVLLLICSCTKQNTSQPSNFSKWTISNSQILEDNDIYLSEWTDPTGVRQGAVGSKYPWNSSSNYLSGLSFVYNSSGNNVKTSSALLKFATKPTVNGKYTISPTSTNLTSNQCYLQITAMNDGLSTYEANSSSQTIDVTINNGLINASFNDLSFSGTNNKRTGTFTAKISGQIIQEEL